MKNYRLSLFTDAFLCGLTAFFFTKAATSFFFKQNVIAVIISLFTAACACAITVALARKKNEFLFLKERDLNYLSNVVGEFEIIGDNRLIEWFLQLFTRLGIAAEKQGNAIKLNGKAIYLEYDEILSRERAATRIRQSDKNGSDVTVIFCREVSSEAERLRKLFPDKLFFAKSNYLFELMQKANFFYQPKILIFKKRPDLKTRAFAFFKRTFTKKRAVTFLFIGAVTLLFSSFTLFIKYYLVYSLFCFALSFACLFFGKEEPTVTPCPPVLL